MLTMIGTVPIWETVIMCKMCCWFK